MLFFSSYPAEFLRTDIVIQPFDAYHTDLPAANKQPEVSDAA
jgi:hypothetical protein